MYQSKGKAALNTLNEIMPFNEVLAEFQPNGTLKHSLVLNCDDLQTKICYLNLCKNLSGEMKELATDIYIDLCKQDNLI